tara:strand:- start:1351 stop:1995 length:645 start_codon:yes stop_codon:yes gene_type:complete
MAKYRRETTPQGVAYYPWLSKPDVKFGSDKGGNYKCDVFIDNKDAKPLMKIIDDTLSEYHLYMEKTEGKKFALNDVPYVIHGDKTRDPNNVIPQGSVMFKIKQYGMLGGKPFRPIVVDAKGKPMLDANGDNITVFGGSKVRVSCDLFTYAVGNNLGVTLKLVGVQVIELQDSAEPDLSKLGFKEEEGYSHSQEDLTFAAEDTSDKKEKESNDFL